MTVSVPLFVDAMEAKWAEFGNVVSKPLRRVWGEIAAAMNRQVEAPSLPRPVLPAELGAGKTTAAKMFCSMLAADYNHPGVLAVVRTIDQAEEYAREISAWGGAAFAFHSELRPKPDPNFLMRFPTLVICHRGYELALDDLTVEESERYDRLMKFGSRRRRLVIVDEALDQVYVARIPRKGLRRVLGLAFPEKIQRGHVAALKVLDSVNHALLEAPNDSHHVVSADALLAGTRLSVEQADAALVEFWGAVRDLRMQQDDKRLVKETLTALRRHLALYRWTEGEMGKTALVGSRLLLPPDAGQVILDATGTLNNVYLGRPDAYEVQTLPPVRDYQNVTLYAARTVGTGKWAMARRGSEIAREVLDAVLMHYGERTSERRVLVVADLDREEEVQRIWSHGGFAELAVAHWNKIDGRNEWREFDTLVALSLHYGPSSLDLAAYTAIKGVELDDSGLNAPPDEVRTMREARVAGTLAQAIGRIRLRRMTHADGTCEPCEVFVRFPNFDVRARTNVIIGGLQSALTGLRVVEWAA